MVRTKRYLIKVMKELLDIQNLKYCWKIFNPHEKQPSMGHWGRSESEPVCQHKLSHVHLSNLINNKNILNAIIEVILHYYCYFILNWCSCKRY